MNRSFAIQSRGFTLLELLIALAVFAVLATMAYGTLSSVLRIQTQTEEAALRLNKIQNTFLVIERDIQQAVARPIRNEFGDAVAALVGNEIGEYRLEFTHTGYANPDGEARSFLQRVAYAMPEDEEKKLYRYTWPVLDRTENEPHKVLLLENVEELLIQYFDEQQQASSDWPNPLNSGVANNPELLPRAIEVNLTLKGEGKFWRLIILFWGRMS